MAVMAGKNLHHFDGEENHSRWPSWPGKTSLLRGCPRMKKTNSWPSWPEKLLPLGAKKSHNCSISCAVTRW